MAVITDITKTLDVPGEPGASIGIRMVSWPVLELAQQARFKVLTEQLRAVSAVKDLLPKGDENAKPDRVLQYDKLLLLKAGLCEWSYPGDVDPEKLDAATATWAARAILDYSLPDAAEVKDDASHSTST